MMDERGPTWLALPELLLTALLNFRKILTPDFFALSEAIWEIVGSVCLSLFVGLLFVSGLFVSVEIDSLRLGFGTVALAVLFLVLHAINRRLFRMLDEFVLGNQLVLTDYTLTDAFAAFAVLARLHQLNAIFAIFGASDRDKSLDLKGRGLRNRL